jgi:hypothetical protein
MEKIRE